MVIRKWVKKFRQKWHSDLYREFSEVDEKVMLLMNLMKPIYYNNPEEELSFLFDMYGSDKGSKFGKKGAHTYTNTYHLLFSPIRDEVKAVFECGIFRGASLRAWRDYFKNAVIVGGDINENSLFEDVRIHTGLLDQMNPESVEIFFSSLAPRYPNDFDIIIDDGYHIYEAAVCLFEKGINHLKPNGIYVIEDMFEEYFPRYKEHFRKYVEEKKITVEYKIMSNVNGDPQNNLIIIRKLGN
jgi:SAM-dependent methyltransferase